MRPSQLTLNLNPAVEAASTLIAHGGGLGRAPAGFINNLQLRREDDPTYASAMPEPSEFFDFPGRIIQHLKNSFQYRQGHKITPPDEYFDAQYKLNQYD